MVTVRAVPSTGWSFGYWLVNGLPAGNDPGLSVVVNGKIEITPVFSHEPMPGAPMVSVSFFSKGANSSGIVIDGANYALPAKFSWAVGSSHTASVQGVIPVGSAKPFFIGWQGGMNSSSPILSFLVKGNVTVIAAYQTRYLANFVFLDSTGAVVSPEDATLLGPEGLVPISPTNSSGWLAPGVRYTLVGATTGGVSVTPLLPRYGTVEMTQPGTVRIPLSIYPVSIRVVDVFRQPVSGASVTLMTEGGRVFTQVTGKDGSAAFAGIPMGMFSATYTYLGVSGSIASQAAGAHSDTVTLVLSYPLVAVVAIFTTVFAIAIVRTKRRASGEPLEYDTPY
jgi:hypothetical protein